MKNLPSACLASPLLFLVCVVACESDDPTVSGVAPRPDKAPFDGGGGAGGLGGAGGPGEAGSTPSGLTSYDELLDLDDEYVDRLRECEVIDQGGFRAHAQSLPNRVCLYECYFAEADCGVVRDEFCGTSETENEEWESCVAECNQAFVCGDGTEIVAEWQCDTYLDCEDGSDEAGCAALWFACGQGTPVLASQVCDGIPQCPNARDEEDCTEFFSCDFERAIPSYQICDGRPQCDDGSDEQSCANSSCR